MLYELAQQECWQQKLKEGITYETGMASTSAYKPRSSKANKGKRYHSKNNAVAWQEHQLAHRQGMKGDMGERAVESDKPVGNGKRMNARKAMDSYGSGAHTQGSSTTYLYPANTGEVGHGLEVRESVVQRQGECGVYFGVSTQALLGEMSCWDDIPPKRGKYKLESLSACYRGW